MTTPDEPTRPFETGGTGAYDPAPEPTDPTIPVPGPPTGPGTAEEPRRKPSLWELGRHRTDIGQLVMGLVFLTFVGCWALVRADVVSGSEIRWLLPIPWVLAGAVGLAATAVSSLRRARREH